MLLNFSETFFISVSVEGAKIKLTDAWVTKIAAWLMYSGSYPWEGTWTCSKLSEKVKRF